MAQTAERQELRVLEAQWTFLDNFCQRQAERLRHGQDTDEDDDQVPYELHASIAQRELGALRGTLDALQRERDQLAAEVEWLRSALMLRGGEPSATVMGRVTLWTPPGGWLRGQSGRLRWRRWLRWLRPQR
jgi:hypothetical protein